MPDHILYVIFSFIMYYTSLEFSDKMFMTGVARWDRQLPRFYLGGGGAIHHL